MLKTWFFGGEKNEHFAAAPCLVRILHYHSVYGVFEHGGKTEKEDFFMGDVKCKPKR
jgi:hypothetical protein